MATLSTPYILFSGLKGASVTIRQIITELAKWKFPANFSWNKSLRYLSAVLQQAFKDNVLSEIEMEFLLITISGYLMSVKNAISNLKLPQQAIFLKNNLYQFSKTDLQ